MHNSDTPWTNQGKTDCISIEGRSPANALCSCDLDLDQMTLICEFDLKIAIIFHHTKMKWTF